MESFRSWLMGVIRKCRRMHYVLLYLRVIRELMIWNDNDGIQFSNNCYNYACDIQTHTFAQPGKSGNTSFLNMSCTAVSNSAKSDGLIFQDCDKPCPDNCHKVALVIAPGLDYHWYRQHRNRIWSHKPGRTLATIFDNSGYPIFDPRRADRGPYTEFCGCFFVNRQRVSIE